MNRASGTKTSFLFLPATFTFFSLTKGRKEKGRGFISRGGDAKHLCIFSFLSPLSNLSSPRLIDHKNLVSFLSSIDVISRERQEEGTALSFRIKMGEGETKILIEGGNGRRNAGEYYESFFRAESRKSLSNPRCSSD